MELTISISSWPQLSYAGLTLLATTCLLIRLLATRNKPRQSSKYQQSKADKVAENLLWRKLDTVGILPGGLFRWPRAILASLISLRHNTFDGYDKYSKQLNKPFALPTIWTGKAVVVLPLSQLHIVNKPESELTAFQALVDTIQLNHFFDLDILENAIHFEVTRKDLTRGNVDRQAEPTAEEVDLTFLNGWDLCSATINRVALKTLLGAPMCRDKSFLKQTTLFSNCLFAAAAILNGTPPSLRGVVGAVVSLPAKFFGARCKRILLPLVKERIRLWEENEKRKEKGESTEELPSDFLQWLIPRCANHGPEHMNPAKITERLMALNTMFIFAMGYVFSHTVVDICASPESEEYLSGIKHEAQSLLSQNPGGLANKNSIDKMYRADSAIRESMRISAVSMVTLPRDIVGTKPLDIGNGLFVLPGTRVAFASQPMHLDPDYYEDPQRFDAFRFSRLMETVDVNTAQANTDRDADTDQEREPKTTTEHQEQQRELIITLSKKFLGFGYGKRACPGRWFVAQTLKQSLAYLAMKYDVESAGPPPKRNTLLNTVIPPVGARLRFRRRVEKEGSRI